VSELLRFGLLVDSLRDFEARDLKEAEQFRSMGSEYGKNLANWHEGKATGNKLAAEWIQDTLADENIKKCADCGKWHLAEGDPVVNERGENICDACHENYIHCEACEEMKVNDQIADWDTKECFSCYEERVPVGRMA
jgi:hypothetical protein